MMSITRCVASSGCTRNEAPCSATSASRMASLPSLNLTAGELYELYVDGATHTAPEPFGSYAMMRSATAMARESTTSEHGFVQSPETSWPIGKYVRFSLASKALPPHGAGYLSSSSVLTNRHGMTSWNRVGPMWTGLSSPNGDCVISSERSWCPTTVYGL